MDQSPKQQIVDKLKGATNILVTVSNDPTVDQLASAIGLTLMLNKIGKHATAVYSGDTPNTLEFLKPEANLHKNTDSLQDFIISLDRAKADKLRYKVEDDVVKIFITPYKTSLSPDDLNFSQGDFNIDAVVALGVDQREHLDQAIVAHGRILHDATVMTIIAGPAASNIGSINWQDGEASSLAEMLVSISEAFQSGVLDEQMATAFLTGIVAQTERFKNPRTTPKVMTMAAQLMAAGANQQLIADSLDISEVAPAQVGLKDETNVASDSDDEDVESADSIKISHDDPKMEPIQSDDQKEDDQKEPKKADIDLDADVAYGSTGLEAEDRSKADAETEGIHIDENGMLMSEEEVDIADQIGSKSSGGSAPKGVTEGPDRKPVGQSSHTAVDTGQSFVMGGKEKRLEPLEDSASADFGPRLPSPAEMEAPDALGLAPKDPASYTSLPNPDGHKTLEQLDQAVGKTEPVANINATLPAPDAAAAREQVTEAIAANIPNEAPRPAKALNALPLEGQDPLVPIDHSNLPESSDNGAPPLPPPPTNPAANGPGLTLPNPS